MTDLNYLAFCMCLIRCSLACFTWWCLFYPIGYIREGFLAIQHALDKAIILYHESRATQLFDDISIFVQRFPYPAYPDDGLLLLTGSFLPLMFILMFSPSVLSIIRSIVWEKEKRLKVIQIIFLQSFFKGFLSM